MLEIGSLVDGKYKVLRVVGKGGMSVVYQAVNEKANKIWAIKEVRKDGVQNFEVVKQNLIVETELLKRFNHPNLPSIIDVIDTEDSFLIVMDYIEGNSLSKALEESGAQDQEDVVEWAKQLCDVLGYLHSRKPPIIYRDMKPANVMLKPDGNISLIDFGTAREFKSTSVEDTTCLGTQGYAAPEQYGGHGQTDARTDVYCLGATMYHLVTGHNPSMPPYEMYPIRQWNPALSSGLEEIITKCTQRNPDDRYQTCAELLYDLEHYRDLDIETRKAQNKKWKLFLTVVILMVVTALGAVGCKIAEGMSKASTYDGLIAKAENAAQNPDDPNAADGCDKYKTAVGYYADAIGLQPDDTKAYEGILSLYKNDNLNDFSLSNKEYLDINTKIFSNEKELLAKDPNAYAVLASSLADKLFFSIVNDDGSQGAAVTNGYQYASNWYDNAINASKDETLKTRDGNLKFLLDSYVMGSRNGSLNTYDTEGNAVGTDVNDLFYTMKEIVESDESNVFVKLRCYNIIAFLMYNCYSDFDVIDSDEFIGLVNTISGELDNIEQDKEYQTAMKKSENAFLGELLTNTRNNIKGINKLAGRADAAK